MNHLLAAAAVLAVLTGLGHTVIGEVMIFRHLRRGTLVPTRVTAPMREFQLRIIWASWHLLTLLGWALAGVLWLSAVSPGLLPAIVLQGVAVAFALSGLLVLIATRGRHPAWAVLLVISALIVLA